MRSDAQREDCALMRVDAGGRTAHVCLSQKPRHAERVKACLRIPAAMRQTDARAAFKISTKGACAVDKGEYIHVIVRTRIMAIDQPRLGRYGNLAEQRALCIFRCAPDKSLFKMRVDDFAGAGKKLVGTVRAASRADRRIVFAEQAFARRKDRFPFGRAFCRPAR